MWMTCGAAILWFCSGSSSSSNWPRLYYSKHIRYAEEYSLRVLCSCSLQQYGFNASFNIFTKETDELTSLNQMQKAKKGLRTRKNDKEDLIDELEGCVTLDPIASSSKLKVSNRGDTAGKKTLTWENLNYHVPGPNGPIRLLHDVVGYVKPGTLTALMGASGAGMHLPHLLATICSYLLRRENDLSRCTCPKEKHWCSLW